MKYKIGLTGSIGMGKSTTAALFADAGCVVWDADAAVHRLYGKDGAAVAALEALFPQAIADGEVDRAALRQVIADDPSSLKQIEAIVHPLVQADRAAFIVSHPDRIGVFDIPLLFETGGDIEMDATACVSVPRETQIERVLARGTMTADDLDRILSRQMPNDEKCARSTYVIQTDTFEHAKAQVRDVMKDIERRMENA
ncbi:dephospho-CoA kinase [Mameliella alba]|nr:dephospho-CoA kinase [Mameliella alba]MBY6167959.1 dephospho-CoA kinase [Mameliella alba]MBY6172980.1 dephospho-CoA kinase [Mameliella alba]